jgi:hypothetical protein
MNNTSKQSNYLPNDKRQTDEMVENMSICWSLIAKSTINETREVMVSQQIHAIQLT